MDISIKNKDIEFFTDSNGFLNIKTVDKTTEIIQRLKKRVTLNVGTHKPRPNQGHQIDAVLQGKTDAQVLESSIYEDLSSDEDIDENTLTVELSFDGRAINIVVNANLSTGARERIQFEVNK